MLRMSFSTKKRVGVLVYTTKIELDTLDSECNEFLVKRIICLFPRNPGQKNVFRMIHGARIPWYQWAKIWSDFQCNHVWYLCQVSRVSFFGKKRDVTVGLRILGF